MCFRGYPFPENSRSFVDHAEVLKYLQNYAKDINQFIQFNSKVAKVTRDNREDKWNVRIQKTKEDETEDFTFDAVFVCNGHFFKPRMPGFSKDLSIPFVHSHDYRSPSFYSGKTVAIIGAGPSGVDIALQVCKDAKKVYLCHRTFSKTKLEFPENVKIVPGVSSASENKLILENGETLENLGAVIFCTGYRMSLDFFDSDIVTLKENDSFVSPLFAHVAHINFVNSLFFIGLNMVVLPFVLFDYQIALALSLMEGRAEVIGKEEINTWEQRRLE